VFCAHGPYRARWRLGLEEFSTESPDRSNDRSRTDAEKIRERNGAKIRVRADRLQAIPESFSKRPSFPTKSRAPARQALAGCSGRQGREGVPTGHIRGTASSSPWLPRGGRAKGFFYSMKTSASYIRFLVSRRNDECPSCATQAETPYSVSRAERIESICCGLHRQCIIRFVLKGAISELLRTL